MGVKHAKWDYGCFVYKSTSESFLIYTSAVRKDHFTSTYCVLSTSCYYTIHVRGYSLQIAEADYLLGNKRGNLLSSLSSIILWYLFLPPFVVCFARYLLYTNRHGILCSTCSDMTNDFIITIQTLVDWFQNIDIPNQCNVFGDVYSPCRRS